MLIFTRRIGEKVVIGDEILIDTVNVSEDGQSVTFSIRAPDVGVIHSGKSVEVHPKHNRPVITVKRRNRLLMAAEASAKQAKR